MPKNANVFKDKLIIKYAKNTEAIIGASTEVFNHKGGGFQEGPS